MISINNLTIKYGNHTVIDNLNIDIHLGFVYGLVGLNGSGKTTLLNALYGIVKKTSGRIFLNDKILKKSDLSFLPTENYFYSNITAREYINFFRYYNPSFSNEYLLNIFDLPLDSLIESYSTGMKKKLAILACLVLDKKIMILDEPFNGLDVESVYIVNRIINILKDNGKTIIITSHILDSLRYICDSIFYLSNGKIQNTFDKSEFYILDSLLKSNLDSKYKELDKLSI